jgi:hypothetical protein
MLEPDRRLSAWEKRDAKLSSLRSVRPANQRCTVLPGMAEPSAEQEIHS